MSKKIKPFEKLGDLEPGSIFEIEGLPYLGAFVSGDRIDGEIGRDTTVCVSLSDGEILNLPLVMPVRPMKLTLAHD